MAILVPILTARTEKPGEFYPFSNYPMYDSFEDETYYVKVTDGQDQIVPVGAVFGTTGSEVKKVFDRKLLAAKKASGGKVKKADLPPEVQQKAAVETLEWLRANAPLAQKTKIDALHTLRLHRVDLQLINSKVQRTSKPTGEVRF
jgi:hypothetical protein